MTPHASAVVRPEHQKAAAVEFWRFAFTVLVCLFHLEVNYRQTLLTSGSSAVEFFFVLSGFLIAMSASRRFSGSPEPVTAREARDKAVAFVVKKLRVIYPILIFVMLYIITINYRLMGSTFDKLQFLQNSEWELLLLTGTPLGYNNGLSPVIPLWFLTVLLLVGYVMTYVVYRHNDFVKFAAPVAGLLFYIYFALNSSTILDQPLRMGFTTAGMIRGISEMSFGVALFYLYEYLSVKQLGRFWRVLLSLAELYAIYRFFALTLYQPVGFQNFSRIIYIMLLVLFSFWNVTLFSRLMNRRFWHRLGRITLAMYMCHYGLLNTYFVLLNTVRYRLSLMKSPLAQTLSDFLKDTGGLDGAGNQLAMTWKDALAFLALVILVSLLLTLLIDGIQRFIVKPLKALQSQKQAIQRETADTAH